MYITFSLLIRTDILRKTHDIVLFICLLTGTIEIFSIREMKLLKSLQISSASIIELSVVAELYLVAIDELNDVYTLCTDVILEKSEEDNDQTVNSLGESSRGIKLKIP